MVIDSPTVLSQPSLETVEPLLTRTQISPQTIGVPVKIIGRQIASISMSFSLTSTHLEMEGKTGIGIGKGRFSDQLSHDLSKPLGVSSLEKIEEILTSPLMQRQKET